MTKPEMLTVQIAPSVDPGAGEIIECARQVIALTDDLCEHAAAQALDSLSKHLCDRDMLLVRLAELKEQHWTSVRTAANKDAIVSAVRAVMVELETRDRELMERLQKRKHAAFVALVEAQKQHQITHYVR
jgi:hypothetical protein